MKAVLIAGGILLSAASAQAHTIVLAGVGQPSPLCEECGTLKFSGGARHTDAVRMTIGVGSGAAKSLQGQNYLFVAFRLDSFIPNATDTICTVQLERGPERQRIDPMTGGASLVIDNWPAGTETAGYYDQHLGAYVVQIKHTDPDAFWPGSVLGLSAFCPIRNK